MTSESEFVAALRALATDPAARGLMDDAAVLEFGGEALVLTCDTLVEGVHVLPGADPADVAWKLVASNMSDLAAKGAEPLGLLMSYALGEGDARFLDGLAEALEHFGVALLGGDTTAAPSPRSFGATVIGRASYTPVPSRSGARSGDGVFVTGKLGAAMMAFEAARDDTGGDTSAHRRPLARLAEGRALAPFVTAMMDISDGLLLDASRMATASAASIRIDSAAVPIACPPARRFDALRWGEDFELLFTLPANTQPPVSATCIGEVGDGAGIWLDGEDFTGRAGLGYQHRAGSD